MTSSPARLAPITEPAVGLGLAGGLIFLHGKLAEDELEGSGRRPPPGVSAAFGMYTSNGSWGTGAAHLGHWLDGSIRYLGVAGYLSLQLTGDGPGGGAYHFGLAGVPLVQDLTFRIGGGDLFMGARYIFLQSTVTLDVADGAALPSSDLRARLSGLGPVVRWDGRDSIFSPSAGVRAEGELLWYEPWLVGSMRLDLQLSGGDLPLWYRPFDELRGIPALRYQGRHVAAAETEQRIDFTPRWSAVVFAGAGVAAEAPQPTLAWNAGTGFRYLVARQFRVRVGVDVARGPEQWAGYVVFGNAWR